MQYQVLAASVEELREAYQDSLTTMLKAREADLPEVELWAKRESEYWKVEFLQRLKALSESIRSNQADK